MYGKELHIIEAAVLLRVGLCLLARDLLVALRLCTLRKMRESEAPPIVLTGLQVNHGGWDSMGYIICYNLYIHTCMYICIYYILTYMHRLYIHVHTSCVYIYIHIYIC